MSAERSEFLTDALVQDIVKVEELKGRVFDRAEVHGDTVVFIKDKIVVHKHRVVTPGMYA